MYTRFVVEAILGPIFIVHLEGSGKTPRGWDMIEIEMGWGRSSKCWDMGTIWVYSSLSMLYTAHHLGLSHASMYACTRVSVYVGYTTVIKR